MTTTAQEIIDRANLILQDIHNTRWSQSELLGWLNEGQLMVVNLQPSSYSEYRTLDLTPGTQQTLPDDNIRLLDIVRNQDGVYNTSIRVVARIDLDTQVPNWHRHKPNHIVQHYMYDMVHPDIFYVYPPQPEEPHPYANKGRIEAILAVVPPSLDTVGDVISLKDIYVPALVDYVVYRAYAKDSESSANQNLKVMYYDQFLGALGRQQTANTGTAA